MFPPQDKYLFSDLTIPAELPGMQVPAWSDEAGAFVFTDQKGLVHSFTTAHTAMRGWHLHVQFRMAQLYRERLNLSVSDTELVDILQEECGEVIQARSKLRRGGDRKNFQAPKHRPDGPTNMDLLAAEIYDVLVLTKIMFDRGLLTMEAFEKHEAWKLPRLHKYSDIFTDPDGPRWEERLRLAGEIE